MYIVIIGGGKVGYYLTKNLIGKEHEILLIEKEKFRFVRLSEELAEAVYRGDGCEASTLETVGCSRADMVIAVTGDDEDNLVICQLAKFKFNVPKTIARVNNPKNEETFKMLGIDTTISATRIILGLLEQEMATPEVVPLLVLQKGKLEIVDVTLGKSSLAVNQAIKDISLPADSIILVVVKGKEEVIIPKGDTILGSGDSVIALIRNGNEKLLRQVLLGEEAY
jgi:trk system potassium uptake protein TrkA